MHRSEIPLQLLTLLALLQVKQQSDCINACQVHAFYAVFICAGTHWANVAYQANPQFVVPASHMGTGSCSSPSCFTFHPVYCLQIGEAAEMAQVLVPV